ncbi:MAG: hypothetical protein HY074_12945 [Deltaproteobacteria bacterium]|nr:hypothetical protein [Deltaproteobacteria bacterium]
MMFLKVCVFTAMVLSVSAAYADTGTTTPAESSGTAKQFQLRFDLGQGSGTSGNFNNGMLKLEAVPNYSGDENSVGADASFGVQGGTMIGGFTAIKGESCSESGSCQNGRLGQLNYARRYWDLDSVQGGPLFINKANGTRYGILVNPFGARGYREKDSDVHWHPTVRVEFEKPLLDKLIAITGAVQGGILYESVGSKPDVGTTVTANAGVRLNLGDFAFGFEFTADSQSLKEVKGDLDQTLRPDRSFTDLGANAYGRVAF